MAGLAAAGGFDLGLDRPSRQDKRPGDDEFLKKLEPNARPIWSRRFWRGLSASEREYVEMKKREFGITPPPEVVFVGPSPDIHEHALAMARLADRPGPIVIADAFITPQMVDPDRFDDRLSTPIPIKRRK
jgi:hypothetical protein